MSARAAGKTGRKAIDVYKRQDIRLMKSVKWWDIIITDISVIFLKNTRA